MDKTMKYESKTIKLSLLDSNKGQIKGLPKNPRIIKDSRFNKLVKSVKESPEFMELRELIVIPFEGRYVVIAGNQRLAACIEIGRESAPCKVLPIDTPIEKLKEYTIKDNVSFGEMDWGSALEEWGTDDLIGWGEEIKEESTNTNGAKDNSLDKSQTTKGIVIKFTMDKYEEAFKLIRDYREQGKDVGELLVSTLKNMSNE